MGLARFKPNNSCFEMGFTRQKPRAATSHEERIAGLSDHSPLILELADDSPLVTAKKYRASMA
jgi:hypothetical protein